MFNFLLLMIFPVLIALLTLLVFKRRILWWEAVVQVAVVALVVGIGLVIAYEGRTSDVEVWNSQVTHRESHHVSCSHSYSCNCRPTYDSKGNVDGETCDTCYEHSFDVDWTVHSSSGESIDIDREDRQGLVEPKRWDAAYPGETFESSHSYTNYIKANPDSVILGTKGDMVKWGKLIPNYPANIYNYYYNDPVVNMGVPGVDVTSWNWLIREANKTLGPKKQVHIIVILVPTNDRNYTYALKDAWFGGKKNDVDVIIGSVDGKTIDFADIMSWSTNKALAVKLRDDIQAVGDLQRKDDIVNAITTQVADNFVRMHMKDMKWLMRSYQPSSAAMIWLFIIGVISSIGISVGIVYADLGEDDCYSDYGHRRYAARLKFGGY